MYVWLFLLRLCYIYVVRFYILVFECSELTNDFIKPLLNYDDELLTRLVVLLFVMIYLLCVHFKIYVVIVFQDRHYRTNNADGAPTQLIITELITIDLSFVWNNYFFKTRFFSFLPQVWFCICWLAHTRHCYTTPFDFPWMWNCSSLCFKQISWNKLKIHTVQITFPQDLTFNGCIFLKSQILHLVSMG